MGYSNLSKWKAPVSPNFQKIYQILKGSYLSKFENDGGCNFSKFWTFMLKMLTYIKILNFGIVFYMRKVVTNP